MKNKKIIPIIIALVVLAIIVSTCQSKDDNKENTNSENTTSIVSKTEDTNKIETKDNRIDISTKEFKNSVIETFKTATEDNDYFTYSHESWKNQYLEISIAPNGKYSDDIFLENAKPIIKKVLEDLKKNEYKSGGIFRNNCEYINVFFLNYDDYGNLNRANAAFIRLEPLDIQNVTEEDISF
jgi:uncharacterized protein YxeA